MREDLVLDHGGVVMHEHGVDGEGRDLGDQDAAEGVGNRGVDADERELRFELLVLVPLDLEVSAEDFLVPGLLFVGVVIGVIGRDCVGYCLLVYAHDLVECKISYQT